MSTSTSNKSFVQSNYEQNTNHYDPDFTAEISTKMRVPEKISVIPGVELRESKIEKNQFNTDNLQSAQEKLNYMRVPNRILLSDDDKHVAGPELYLVENNKDEINYFDENIELKTPANVLTLNDISTQNNDYTYGFDKSILYSNKDNPSINELLNYNSFYNSSQNFGNQNLSDDATIIRKHIKSLNRRVKAIELENQKRYHREIIFYAIGLIYLTAKGLFWFQRMW